MQKQLKNLMLFAFVMATAFNTYAQQNFKASISMGAVYPLNEFASTDYKNIDAGFSESGFTLSFDGDYFITNRFALSGRFYFGMTSINEKQNIGWLEENMGDFFNDDSLLIHIGYWQWSAPLVGIKYNYPLIFNKLYAETGFFTGLNISSIPAQNMIVFDEENKRNIYSENIDKTSLSLPFMIDAGLRLKLNDNIQMKVTAGYYGAKSKYRHVTYIFNENSKQIDEEIKNQSLNIPLRTLNISAGLIYTL